MSHKEYLENNFEESKEFEIEKLKKENKRLREALEYYAQGDGDKGSFMARKALKEAKP